MVNERTQKIVRDIVKLQKRLPVLQAELQKVSDEELSLRQAKLSGEKYSESNLKSAEARYQDLQRDCIACEQGINKLKRKFFECVNDEKKTIENTLQSLHSKKTTETNNLIPKYFETIKEAQILHNLIIGAHGDYLVRTVNHIFSADSPQEYSFSELCKVIDEETKSRLKNTTHYRIDQLTSRLRELDSLTPENLEGLINSESSSFGG